MLFAKLKRLFGRERSIHTPLSFYNTLTRAVDTFETFKGKDVRMYNCGPTVYDRQHIGNLSAAVFADTIRKTLEYNSYKVRQVINITDFGHLSGDNEGDADQGDDRMTKGLKREKKAVTMENMRELATRYMEIYLDDIRALNLPVEKIKFPRASDFIPEQIAMIKTLEEKGYAYQGKGGVYFDTARFPSYGALGNIDLEGLKEGARVVKDVDKHSPTDFLLWKSDKKMGWDSPWGKGFPGWHIECSAMIRATLGEQIDIHTGGIEHVAIHHNNEIAQSECAIGKSPLARFWLHRAHIRKDDSKLAKSTGNTTYLSDVLDSGYHPLALRYWFLTSHYRASSNFTFDALKGSQQALARLVHFVHEHPGHATPPNRYAQGLREHFNNDLDTAGALALVWESLKDDTLSPEEKKAVILEANKVLGLSLDKPDESLLGFVQKEFGLSITPSAVPKEIQTLLSEREKARTERNWAESDRLRDALSSEGFDVKDTPEGQQLSRT